MWGPGKNIERNSYDGALACEVSEENLKVPLRIYQGHLCDILDQESVK